MIDRQGRRTIIECDTCDETFESEEGEDWASVWARARTDGWKSRKISEEWVHGCPRCGV